MKIKSEKIGAMIEEIDQIIEQLINAETEHDDKIQEVHPSFRKSARNLIHYRALRTIDLTSLQSRLRALGLSRMSASESHTMASLKNCRYILKSIVDQELTDTDGIVSIKKAEKIIRTHTKGLLGYRSKGRRVRIMVTLPSEAAYDYELVESLIKSGMNTARINCAHDGPVEWKMMIDHVEAAKMKLNKNCRISMDLAGPKIRTGAIEPGPHVRRFKPVRNELGQVIEAVEINLVAKPSGASNEVPVEHSWILDMEVGNKIKFADARDKKRTLTVKSVEEGKAVVTGLQTCYIQTGMVMTIKEAEHKCEVKELPALEQALLLKIGDTLRILKDQAPGRPIEYNDDGMEVAPAFISCTSSEVFDYVKVGERIMFDDGKITGMTKSVTEDEIRVEIVHAGVDGSSLKADKGINLPETELKITGLTNKDREDLKFIVQYADVVNFSFVNSPEDVEELLTEFEKLDATDKLGIILKIETQAAYNNLTDILIAGMKNYPLGVMIARGDLAIESGWENMARIQQEILLLCSAAHVPGVWATQVLETLAKKGIPTRSEVTDAATALNAECVMLNKGPYILRAVGLLDYILKSLNQYRDKNVKVSPVMEKADTTH